MWMQQLHEGGVLLMPEGEARKHRLVRRLKLASGVKEEYFDACTFVPLVGGETL